MGLFCWGRVRICAGGFMAKIDKIKAKIDWLKELFKIVVTVMVADVAGMAKLYLDNTIEVLFYAGGVLLVVLVLVSVVISRKMEHQISELEDL
jgi:membrane protein YdbS with pleckstrin-like domain